MYNEVVTRLFQSPYHQALPEEFDVMGQAGAPGEGPFLTMYLTVEDDIEPPPDALKALFFGLIRDWDADIVAGIVTDRFTARVLAWTALPDVEMTQEEVAQQAPPGQMLPVFGTGFGCTLFRRSFWESIAFRPSYTWSENYCAYDWAAAYEARQRGRKWLLCGAVRCKHWQENGRHV